MSLRLIEVTVAEDHADEALGVLRESAALDAWIALPGPERAVLRVLATMGQTEGVTDALSDRFGHDRLYRAVVLPVEATLPAPDDDRAAEPDPSAEERPPDRISREELLQDLTAASRLSSVYLVTVALSTIVAAVGLLRDDTAVVVGAMVIAPLLGPQVALSLASALGDADLARRAIGSAVLGALLAILVSTVIGMVITVDPTADAILSRTHVGLGDVALALAAGSAGALAFTSGLPTAVIGVMVAVALLPPTVVFGLMLGGGYATGAIGAGVLVVTNVICVNLAGVVTFLAQRVRPRTWWEEEKARTARRRAVLSWIVMLAILVWIILTWL